LLKSAIEYRNYGFYEEACQNLQQAESFIKNNTIYQIRHLNEKADLSLMIPAQTILCLESNSCFCKLYSNNEPIAEQLLQKAETIARKLDNKLLLAQVFNKQGNMLIISKKSREKALQKYQDSIKYAEQANNSLLIAKANINIAKATFLLHAKKKLKKIKVEDIDKVIYELEKAFTITEKLPTSHDKAFGLLALGNLATQVLQIAKQKKIPKQQVKLQNIANIAISSLQTAKKTAEENKNNIALSYYYGNLGELYFNAERYSDALSLTRKALFLAQQADFLPDKMILPELVYRWYWQLGRSFKAIKQSEEAIEMYLSAIEIIQPIRQSLSNTGYCSNRKPFLDKKDFYNSLTSLYYELIDLLIQQHNKLPHESSKYLQILLHTLERFKIAEFQDYDGDACLKISQIGDFTNNIKKFTNEQTAPKTVIIYPILLSKPQEHTKLLINVSNKLYLIPLDVSYQEIKDTADYFSNALLGNAKDYLEYAKLFYDWLIRPIEAKLKQVDTLVIVPDAILRKIPFAAFHDGNQFLIKKYAVAVTQGLALTKSEPLNIKSQVFLGGLSDAVQDFPKLSRTKLALEKIKQDYYPQAEILFNTEFNKVQFESKIHNNQYSIIHITSHGMFDKNPRKNYFITYDYKITIDRLEQLIKFKASSVELLTLSACQTAKGGNRAALGLAGVAVKTGVKTALANLWRVDEDAASKLTIEFYKQLNQKQNFNIAQALQQAQLELINQEKYYHPYYWAPLILVGNWM